MKVIGMGAPRTLELRLKCCEISIWRDVLRDAQAKELQVSSDASQREQEQRLQQLSRLLREAHAPWRPDQPAQVVGATGLLAPLVRRATAKAVDGYVAAAAGFTGGGATVSPDQLRAALDTAVAWTATLLALHRVDGDEREPTALH